MRRAPIGIFDSGLGGLDVAAAISAHLPHERLLYWGDNARVPYGTKSPHVVQHYTHEAARALVTRGVKALVIACNTASAMVDLHALSNELNVPVFGMIEAGGYACLDALTRHTSLHALTQPHILILATPGTVRSGAYQRTLTELIPHASLAAIACPLFVPLVEIGWSEHPLIVEIVAAQLRDQSATLSKLRRLMHVDHLSSERAPLIALLGCTHYPLMSRAIAQGLDAELGYPLECIDGAQSVAKLLEQALKRAGLLSDAPSPQRHHAHFTDDVKSAASLDLASHFWRQRGGIGELNLRADL